MTGSAHDASAFEHTAASKYPNWFFQGEEFAWGDSAYAVNDRTISIHKKPASLRPENALFDKMASRLRVRSEHCMGALKGRFQCLRGLRVNIMSIMRSPTTVGCSAASWGRTTAPILLQTAILLSPDVF
jgi:hypothetical protein